MTNINVHEAKTHLSRYLQEVQQGEEFLLCRNGVPVALLSPIPKENKIKRKLFGLAKGKGKVTARFFEELSEEELPGFGL